MAAPRKSYETPQPWEEHQGTLVQRVTNVSVEAQRVYAQQQALLPTIHHEHTLDPAIGDHLQDVGKRIQILHENSKKPDKKALKMEQQVNKRVIPSRFPEAGEEDDEEEEDQQNEDLGLIRGRIETMMMDQEWDTRTWNQAKIQIAIETLYDQIEHSDDPRRRALATTMLTRLLEMHESAVEFVESTIPILMNKSFRNLAKKSVNKTQTFRVCTLLSVLAEWFAPILSRDNAIVKSMAFLLQESELCARIVQHHWRGVLLERSLKNRDVDASVRGRIRSMHFIKNVELKHQFKMLRVAIGPEGLPVDALRAYIKILFHLVKPTVSAVDRNRRHVATADQKRLLSSGIVVILASLIPTNGDRVPFEQREARRAITELVKGIVLELTTCFSHEADKVIEIMKSNIIQRVIFDLDQQLKLPVTDDDATRLALSCLEVVATITKAVWQLYNRHREMDAVSASSTSTCFRPDSSVLEAAFLMRRLRAVSLQFLMTSQVMETLLRLLPLARTREDAAMCELVLSTLRSLSGSYGFKPLLDALTRNGGRALEQVILCFDYPSCPAVVYAAVALFHDMTNHADARAGFTTAGATLILSKWCDMGIHNTKQPSRFLLALCGLALLARQHQPSCKVGAASSGNLLASLGSLEARQAALYSILLEIVSDSTRDTQTAALFLHQTTNVFVPIVLPFLVQVKPSDMEPQYQTPMQRSISLIVLGRFFKVAAIAKAAFGEATVIHLALALQCNRLDAVEGKLRKSWSSEDERRLHFLGLKEGCKALSRLARCPTQGVDLSLRPSITSGNVPNLPQAIVCDVVTRMHVLEDILPLIHVPTDATEFAEIEVAMVHAAIELVGYLRPMPYSEDARQQFLAETQAHSHPHGIYAHEKLEMLVTIAAPMILHVLKEKNCGWELVETCCASLSRLAATNQCRSLLLKQGALFIALTHVPEVLYDSQAANKRHAGSRSPVRVDANVDDDGLLDIPASVFTLIAKLCAIAEGRDAIMKAQVLPRVLKRLQLRDAKRKAMDLDVKSEIAVLIQRLAVCNAVEGNTSELFLHFHVIELLAEIVVSHSGPPCSPSKTSLHSPVRMKRCHDLEKWRVLDNVVGAIASMAQDVLVCVPKLARLDVVSRLAPLLEVPKPSNSDCSQQYHVVSLQYHIVSIARSIASYPFGEYHAYLAHVKGSGSNNEHERLSFMDRVKKIAFDFMTELQGRAASFSEERKTIGELARETLSLIRERTEQVEQDLERQRQQNLPTGLSPPKSRQSPATSNRLMSSGTRTPQHTDAFPAISVLSPKRDSMTPSSPSGDRTPGRRCSNESLAPLSPIQPRLSSSSSLPSTIIVGSGTAISHGLDLLATRPPPKPDSTPGPHYIFARPKQKTVASKKHSSRKSRRTANTSDASEQFLMLDPLFQNASRPLPRSRDHESHRESSRHEQATHMNDRESFAFAQDVVHDGHQVSLRAQRSRSGDKYIPSLGHFQLEDPTMNVLRRR